MPRDGRMVRGQRSTEAGLREQLIALKSDLLHFQVSSSSSLVTDSIRHRIRELEVLLAHHTAAPGPAA